MFTCRISVHELVETSYLSGDLSSQGMSVQRAQMGARIHRLLQSQRSSHYRSEVFFRHTTQLEELTIVVEGRADGVEESEEGVCIEEIKSTTLPYEQIDDSQTVHFAQCCVYAYFYLEQHPDQTDIHIRLTYYQVESERIKAFDRTLTRAELTSFYDELIHQYKKWALLKRDLHIQAKTTSQALRFPFAQYRPHQRAFAAHVYQTIGARGSLIVQAPTGIGKTVSTLFPSLKAIGEGKCEKVFYLCAKNMTATVAKDTMRLFYKQPLSLKTVCISAKEKLCRLEKKECEGCPYGENYYGRFRPVLYELLQTNAEMDADLFTAYGEAHTLCPFELSLDAALYAQVIICDYNYVFDPAVYLKRFFEESGSYVFLIDEAHNLIDRAREMYSSELLQDELNAFESLLRHAPNNLRQAVQALAAFLERLREACGDAIGSQSEPLEEIYPLLQRVIQTCDAYLQSGHEIAQKEEILTYYFKLVEFRRVFEYYDENFITWYQNDPVHGLRLRLFCMDPSHPIQERLAHGKAVVYFSATLSPAAYYAALLGEAEKAKRIQLPSIFAREQFELIIHHGISTRYQHRQASLAPLVNAIYHSVIPKAGNYIVFFPSYRYMQDCAALFAEHYPSLPLHVQSSSMDDVKRQAFLRRFETSDAHQLHFCVLGGMFAEGIDFTGEKLIGAIIVGVGLPQLNPESDFIRAHFDEQNRPGYHYAYTFPGMNKVLQAMGRVIRTKRDNGIIVLLDDRYATPLYRSLFPPHYQQAKYVQDALELEALARAFWERQAKTTL